MENKQQILAKRPLGVPDEETWTYTTTPLRPLEDGEMLVEQHYISLDPAMRGWMNESRSYIPPVQIGEVMRAGTVGKVIQTQGKTLFQEGDYITGWGGVQTHLITRGEQYYQVDPNRAPLPAYIGTLGMPGMTAYFGILQEGEIKAGDTALISPS